MFTVRRVRFAVSALRAALWLVVNGLRFEVCRLTVCYFNSPEIVRPLRAIPNSHAANWRRADWVD